ncbi:MAG: hypothetical protein RLZZ183_628 [Actinomycetota bacterium]|jgi:hypothetical protein
MSEDNKIENTQGEFIDDPKEKMLAALAKKQKGHNTGKSSGPISGSKIGAGQTAGAAPKMHRRKAGSS